MDKNGPNGQFGKAASILRFFGNKKEEKKKKLFVGVHHQQT